MEMNTRLQVEHPVTEAITGLDLVAWQIRVARGEPLPITQEQVPLIGHAIEVRLYAEDPDNDFLPSTGTLTLYREAATGAGRRVDSGVAEGDTVSPFYDPMLGKLIAWGENREEARLRLLAMLDETAIGGVRTNLAFLRRVVGHPAFADAELDTDFIPRHETDLLRPASDLSDTFWQQAAEAFVSTTAVVARPDDAHSPWSRHDGLRLGMPAQVTLHLQCNGERRRVQLAASQPSSSEPLPRAIRQNDTLYLQHSGEWLAVTAFDPITEAQDSLQQQGGLTAPMNGSIVRVLVEAGQHVAAGTALIVLEAMKMEHSIRSAQDGVVKSLFCNEGDMVSEGTVLLELEEVQEDT